MNPTVKQKFKDFFGIIFFVAAVIIGAWVINTLFFRSFSVSGPSMETTMYTNDRLIVNRLPVTWNILQRKEYVPERGHVIVFKNPMFNSTRSDEYIVKRVIGLPGDRVVVSGGMVKVYNEQNPSGFNPYEGVGIDEIPVAGNVDRTVPQDEIFVIGDNRAGEYSLDSRNGLGTIPLFDVVGPVAARIFPFDKISTDF